MSKLVIGNDTSFINTIVENSEKAGFQQSGYQQKDQYSLAVFEKLKVKTSNFYKTEEDDFIATAGTLIYKEVQGAESLKKLYEDFNGNVEGVRENIIGNYLLCIKKFNKLYIFCEENNLFNVFYGCNEGEWIVSNSLFDIAETRKDRLTLNKMNLIEYTFQYGILGNGTIFDQYFKLQGDEYISVDLESDSFSVHKAPMKTFAPDFSDEDEIVEALVKQLKYTAGVIGNNFNKTTLCMTGGLDSRIVFSSMLANNLKPGLTYGVGNTSLTNTKNRDLEINRIFSQTFNLDLNVMDWSTKDVFNQSWPDFMKTYGFLSMAYSGSSNVFDEFMSLDTEFIDFGYFGEPFRNIPWIEDLDSDTFSLDRFLTEYYLNPALKDMMSESDYDEFRSHINLKFLKVCDKFNINPQCIHVDHFQYLHNEYRKSADAKMLNLANRWYNSVSILSQKTIQDFSLIISADMKRDAGFMLRMMNMLYPDVLSIPFFSHCENWSFDKSSYRLIPVKSTGNAGKCIKSLLKRIIRNESVINSLKILKLRLTSRNVSDKEIHEIKKGDNLKNEIIDLIQHNKYNLIDDLSVVNTSTAALAHYCQMIYIIEHIMS